jgi:hypothetical protein
MNLLYKEEIGRWWIVFHNRGFEQVVDEGLGGTTRFYVAQERRVISVIEKDRFTVLVLVRGGKEKKRKKKKLIN